MKTIFITGASSGLGKAAAKLFVAKGWRVIATMRQPAEETELTKLDNVYVLPLDVTDQKSIAATVDAAVKIAPIDLLFNNAGYGLTGPLEGYSDAQITRQFDTNVLGVIRVTQAFLPHIRQNGSGLIINTSSIAGHIAFPFSSIYHATKWALEGWSESLSIELAPFHIGVKTVAPGGIATDFMARSLDVGQHADYAERFTQFMASFQQEDSPMVFSTPESIADIVYEAATDGKAQLRYFAGPDAVASYKRRLEIGAEAFRKELAAGLGIHFES